MRANILRHGARFCVAVGLLLGGCGAETPPYDELPLRDALSAAPEVLASLPEQSRRDIALRLEAAQANGEEEETTITSAGIPTLPALVRSADASREEGNKDAVVLGAIEPSSQGFVLRSLSPGEAPGEAPGGAAGEAAGNAPAAPFAWPVLSGEPAGSSASLESAALRGRAGVILDGLAKRSDAHDLVRVTGVPAGVIAMGQTVYVNASWLVALSALEPADAAALPAPGRGAFAAPPLEPRSSVRANPYKLPASIAECAVDVRDVCTCATAKACDHEPTDPSFASGQLECEWVSADSTGAEALCVLALMSIDGVKECVQSAGAACARVPLTNREQALAFAADAGCMAVLDHCLQYGEPFDSSGGSGSCGGCDSSDEQPPDNSGSSSSGCNKSCSDCNQNCSDCNQNCSDCNKNNSDCNKSCKSSAAYDGSAATCRLSADRRPRPSGRGPLGTAFWLLAPAGYMARRTWRRS